MLLYIASLHMMQAYRNSSQELRCGAIERACTATLRRTARFAGKADRPSRLISLCGCTSVITRTRSGILRLVKSGLTICKARQNICRAFFSQRIVDESTHLVEKRVIVVERVYLFRV